MSIKSVTVPGLKYFNTMSKRMETAVASILEDENGIICAPISLNFKSGWGKTLEEAITHCQERNSVHRCYD